jgi:Mrp family chromosome partitioning ATPase
VHGIEGYGDGSLRDYLAALRRKKVMFLVAVVLVPAAALFFTLGHRASYQATASVLVSNVSTSPNADRVAQTQVSVARVPVVAERALRAAHVSDETAAGLLAHSSVVAVANADVLDFTVTDPSPSRAQALVNAYVNQFVAYRAELNAAPLAQALQDIRKKIAQLASDQAGNSQLLASLRTEQTQLETELQVQGSDVDVLRTASSATNISPHPKLLLLIGVILGLVLGTALALLADALDPHLRSAAEAGAALDLPLLGVVPRRGPREQASSRLAMLSEPHGAQADAMRILKTKFVLANPSPRVVMFVSAAEDDGKLEVAANLAVSLARGHRRVTLLDLDSRQDALPRLLGAPAPNLSRASSLDEALVEIAVSDGNEPDGRFDTRLVSEPGGQLRVLFAASFPKDAELVDAGIVPSLLDAARTSSDFVLINAPPMLRVSDALVLATMVDALVVVADSRSTRRSDLLLLRQTLSTVAVPKLGVILIEVSEKEARRTSVGGLAPQGALATGSASAPRLRASRSNR